MQACTWNLQGKQLTSASDYIHLSFDPEIILLQEVGSTADLPSAPNGATGGADPGVREVSLGLEHDLFHHRVFCGHNESHLAQVIAIDSDIVQKVLFTHTGLRFVAVGFLCCKTNRNSLAISAHLPHCGRSQEEYVRACQDLVSFISRYPQYDCLLGGDWNCEPHDDRSDHLLIPLTVLGAVSFFPTEPTRVGRTTSRRLDFFFLLGFSCNMELAEAVAGAQEVRVLSESSQTLHSDHNCVLFDFALTIPGSENSTVNKRRRRWLRHNRKRWCINRPELQRALTDSADFSSLNAGQQWRSLRNIAERVSFQLPSRKYKDSALLQDLCRERRISSDPTRRTALTKLILAQRQLEREHWCKTLLEGAAAGDFESIRQVTRDVQSKPNLDAAISRFGSRADFVAAVHEHFSSKFDAPPVQSPECFVPQPSEAGNQPALFTELEVATRASRMKSRKTSGCSGLSADLLKALSEEPAGLTLLTQHLNCILLDEPLDEQRIASLVLIPKTVLVATPKDYRPIAIMEAIHKLFMGLLVQRVQTTWDAPRSQMGGYKGSQVLDALFLATTKLEKQSLEGTAHIWVSADIEAAFDSVDWQKLHESLWSMTSQSAHVELGILLREIRHHKLELQWEGRLTKFQLHRGVLQGGCHSSQVFSAVLECLFLQLREKWHRHFPDMVDAWCYVDDCIIVFKTWDSLHVAFPWLLEQLQAYGFTLSTRKTRLCSTPLALRQGRDRLSSLPPFIRQCQWVSEFPYLGMTLCIPELYSGDGPAMSDLLLSQCKQRVMSGLGSFRRILRRCHYVRWRTALQLLDVFIGSRWLWASPCMHPTRTRLAQVQSFQLGILAHAFKLYVPDWANSFQQRALHRLRRRACSELLRVRAPSSDWGRSWVARKWRYLGHVLRYEPHHLTRAALLQDVRQAREGRAITSARWLISCLRYVHGSDLVSLESLANLYCCRDEWQGALGTVLNFHGQPATVDMPTVHEGTWQKWSHPHTCQLTWLHVTCCWIDSDAVVCKWLDAGHGWMQISVDGTWVDVLTNLLAWRNMVSTTPPFVSQVLMASADGPSSLARVTSAMQHINSTGDDPLLMLEQVPQDWIDRVSHL